MTRLMYATMLLLSAALGMSVIIAAFGISFEPPHALAIAGPVLFILRALACFAAACGFAILFKSSLRNVLYIGLLAIVGNEIRLGLLDVGMDLPVASFAGTFAVGLMATFMRQWLKESRIALTVPGVIIMVPGVSAFKMLVLFNQGEILPALQAAVLVVFVIGAMAIGLAAARFVSQRHWLKNN